MLWDAPQVLPASDRRVLMRRCMLWIPHDTAAPPIQAPVNHRSQVGDLLLAWFLAAVDVQFGPECWRFRGVDKGHRLLRRQIQAELSHVVDVIFGCSL